MSTSSRWERDLRPASPRTTSAPALDGVRILVVDDDEDARELLRALLEARGADVTMSSSVADALVQLTARPDVIVSDIAMPEADGYALARAVRGREQETGQHVPMVAVTAYAASSDRARALEAGFDLHFAKPVDLESLALAIGALQASGATRH